MTTRGRPRKNIVSPATTQQLSSDAILLKLDHMEGILVKNQKDIEDLKHQVAMGKGGIKAVFIIGAIVAAIATGFGLYKNVGGG